MVLTIAHQRTLDRELDERVRRHPDKPWLVFQPVDGEPLTLSYAEFAAQVNRTANALLSLDVRPGDTLLLVLAVARAADAVRCRRLGLRRVLVCGADAGDPDALSPLVRAASADVPTGQR